MAGIYVQIDPMLHKSPKTRKLARELGCDRDRAVGLAVRLWCFTVMCAEDGDLSDYTQEDLEEELGGKEVVSAMQAAGFLKAKHGGKGSRMEVNGWQDWTGGGLKKRASAKQRKRQQREREQETASCDVTVTQEGARDGHTPSKTNVTPEWTGMEGNGLEQEGTGTRMEGGAGGTTQEQTRAPGDAQQAAPPGPPKPKPSPDTKRADSLLHGRPLKSAVTLDDLEAHRGGEWLRALRRRFPAYDGHHGRPTLKSLLKRMLDWRNDQRGSKRRHLEGFFEQWLEKDYGRTRFEWEKTGSPPPHPDDYPMPEAAPQVDRRTEEQKRADEAARAALEDGSYWSAL